MPTLKELQDSIDKNTLLVSSSRDLAVSSLNNLNRCNCGKGKALGQCRPLIRQYSFGDAAILSDCKSPSDLDKCISDCCSKGTCESKVNDYNNKLSDYNSAVSSLDISQTAFNNFVGTDPRIRVISIIVILAAISAILIVSYIFLKKKG